MIFSNLWLTFFLQECDVAQTQTTSASLVSSISVKDEEQLSPIKNIFLANQVKNLKHLFECGSEVWV